MATYRFTIEAKSITSLKSKLNKLGIEATIEKVEHATSRAGRLSEAESDFENAKSVVTELKEEMENWRDNLPENLQNSDKASQIEDCISQLEDIESNMESCDFSGVDFPRMY